MCPVDDHLKDCENGNCRIHFAQHALQLEEVLDSNAIFQERVLSNSALSRRLCCLLLLSHLLGRLLGPSSYCGHEARDRGKVSCFSLPLTVLAVRFIVVFVRVLLLPLRLLIHHSFSVVLVCEFSVLLLPEGGHRPLVFFLLGCDPRFESILVKLFKETGLHLRTSREAACSLLRAWPPLVLARVLLGSPLPRSR